ncbi:MAG: hypothetical protein LBV44_08535 [Methylobacillus sp.]|jgi:hypothetical protein|nr:hypothetical protein [Methylobacillus sp.]
MKQLSLFLLGGALLANQAYAAPACPANDFQGFAEKFVSSVDVQKKFTQWPLKVTWVDDPAAEPKPTWKSKQVSKKKASFPLIESRKDAQKTGREISIEHNTEMGDHIRYRGADNGVLIYYKFKRTDSCWQLVEMDDESV